MPTSTISYLWRDPSAARTFRTGVSLHSHTNQSQETLDFVAEWGAQYKLVRPLLERLERRSHNNQAFPSTGPAATGRRRSHPSWPLISKAARSKSWTWRR